MKSNEDTILFLILKTSIVRFCRFDCKRENVLQSLKHRSNYPFLKMVYPFDFWKRVWGGGATLLVNSRHKAGEQLPWNFSE